MATDAAGEHSDELADFGYNQTLDRSIGKFASFAAGISYISILTGTFQLFYFGFAFGGPAYWWSWPIVFVGQLMVALCFAEFAANYITRGPDILLETQGTGEGHDWGYFGAFLAASLASAYWFVQRHKTGVLASHAAIERELAPDPVPAAS